MHDTPITIDTITANRPVSRKPAGRWCRTTTVDAARQRVLVSDPGHGSFWVSFTGLMSRWRTRS